MDKYIYWVSEVSPTQQVQLKLRYPRKRGYIYLYHSCRSNSHGLKMIFPGNFLSGIVYFPVISPPAVYISLLFSLTTAAAVSSSYIMSKW